MTTTTDMKKEITNVTLATELFAVLKEKEVLEEREEGLRAKLLESLKVQGVGYVRLDDGTSFSRSHRESFVPKFGMEAEAFDWAEKFNCLKIDSTKATKIFKRDLEMPKFFERKIGGDYLTVKSGKEHDL